MSEALKLWLRESWELWYWAMFFPSRLLERMNEWSPNEKHYDEKKTRKGPVAQVTFFTGRKKSG